MSSNPSAETVIAKLHKKTEYNRRWIESHKEQYDSYMSAIQHCDCCNKDIKRRNMSAHKQSKKHQQLQALYSITNLIGDTNQDAMNQVNQLKELVNA